jgi:hypothetical protein
MVKHPVIKQKKRSKKDRLKKHQIVSHIEYRKIKGDFGNNIKKYQKEFDLTNKELLKIRLKLKRARTSQKDTIKTEVEECEGKLSQAKYNLHTEKKRLTWFVNGQDKLKRQKEMARILKVEKAKI